MFDHSPAYAARAARDHSPQARQLEIHDSTFTLVNRRPRCVPAHMLTQVTLPEKVVRQAARAVILDPDHRILLVHFHDDDRGARWWATPGGGLRPGETRELAVLREVAEETTRTDLPLGPCIWTRRDEFESAGRLIEQYEWFFLINAPAFVARPDTLEEQEKAFIRGYRWWRLDEIHRSTEEFAPRDLAERLERLLVQGPPADPVEVGR